MGLTRRKKGTAVLLHSSCKWPGHPYRSTKDGVFQRVPPASSFGTTHTTKATNGSTGDAKEAYISQFRLRGGP